VGSAKSARCSVCSTPIRRGRKHCQSCYQNSRKVDPGNIYAAHTVITDAPDYSYTDPVYDRAADAFYDAIGRVGQRFMQPTPSFTGQYHNVSMVMNDVHAPWCDQERLIESVILATEVYGATRLILTGDTVDLYSVSRWAKDREISLKAELAKARVIVEFLASNFPAVEIVYGNHDGVDGKSGGRMERFLQEQVSSEIRFLVKDIWSDILLADLPNVRLVGVQAPFGSLLKWIYAVGQDAVLAHWQLSSAAQGANVKRFHDWVREWAPVIPGLPREPRLILTGHTHRGTTLEGHDYKLIENGNMASWEAQEYMFGPSGKGPRAPGTRGWTLLVQDDCGRTDLRQTRFMRCDA